MKKLMTLMCISLLASSLAFAQDTQVSVSKVPSVACMDTQEAMRTSKEGQKVGKELEAKKEQLSAPLKKKEAVLVTAVEEFKTKGTAMSKAEQEAEQQRLMKMDRDLKSDVEEAELAYKLEGQKAMEALGKEIEAAVQEVAVKNGLDIVIDARSGQILYASDDALYTNDLVKEMDKNYNAKVAKANTAKKQGA